MTISNFKTSMIAKAKRRGGIWENFGQKEIHTLKDKYKYDRYSHDEKMKKIVQQIDELDNWCMTFDLSQLN